MIRRFATCRAGSSAVEFALISVPLILLVMGIVEFGRAMLIYNDLAYAADRAARTVLLDPEAEGSVVVDAFRAAFSSGDPARLEVTDPVTETSDDLRLLRIRAAYPLVLLVPGGGAINLSIDRRIPLG